LPPAQAPARLILSAAAGDDARVVFTLTRNAPRRRRLQRQHREWHG